MASFVSATELDAKRQQRKQQKREYHEEILREAKEKFHRQRRLQEEREKRGDDKWVAPGVSSRLGLEDGEPDLKKKKKKKKHQKKKKSHKKERRKAERKDTDDEDSADSSEAVWVDSSEAVWVEQSGQPEEKDKDSEVSAVAPVTLERDSWMTMALPPSMAAQSRLAELAEMTSTRKERKAEESKVQMFDQPGQHPKELNPYWRGGGKGLPSEEMDSSSHSHGKTGDGGRSWLLRSYKRALERAEEEGRSIDEIATERWGSFEKLHSLLHKAGIDPANPDKQPERGRREYLYSRFSNDRHSSRDDDDRNRRRYDRTRGRESRDHLADRDRPRIDFSSLAFMKPGEEKDSRIFQKPASYDSDGWRKKPSASSDKPVLKPSSPPRTASYQAPSRDPRPPSNSQDTPPRSHAHSVLPQSSSAGSKPVSDSQINSIAAKLMKAEIMGDNAKIERLKKQLTELREQQNQHQLTREDISDGKSAQEEVILLTKTDRFGHSRPVDLARGKPHNYPSKPRGPSTHTEKGKRKKYFADDDEYSLRQLMEQERLVTAEETQAAIARMATKFVPAANSDDTVDDVMDSKIAVKYNPEKEMQKQQQKAIAENNKMAAVLENCKLCFDNAGFEKQLLIAVGISVYLAAPSHQSLTEGHCLLIPMEHTACSMLLDENVWSEIEIFRKGLTAMFAEQEKDVVFMETCFSTKGKRHMCIECIPIPREAGELAPMYFKKAIMESDEEWSDNRKVIDTSKKGVRGSLPTGLPYFFAEFGTDGGFAHIIENQDKFPHYFGKEVCGGMLDAEPRLWLKPPRENFERQKEKVVQLSEWWSPFDWTQKLKNRSN